MQTHGTSTLSRKQNLGINRNVKGWPHWKNASAFLAPLWDLEKGSGRERGWHPGHQHAPWEGGSWEPFLVPAAVLPTIYYTNQEKQHSSHGLTWTPSPQGMLFLARDLPKETTSAEPLPERSGESWGSWKIFGPFLDPNHKEQASQRAGWEQTQ